MYVTVFGLGLKWDLRPFAPKKVFDEISWNFAHMHKYWNYVVLEFGVKYLLLMGIIPKMWIQTLVHPGL